MKTAFLFPGQGSQYPGMGRDLYEAFPAARVRFDAADEHLGFSLTALMFGDEAEALKQTDVTQPALYVHSMATMAVLAERDGQPDMTAGHSLGEYSALVAAGALSFEDGLRIVHLRSRLMAEAGARRPGAMAAILGLDDAVVADLCRDASGPDALVQSANFNAPGQVVVSGDVDAVERAMGLARDRGSRVVALPVSGAFHSPLMAHARDRLAQALHELTLRPPRCPVYMNVTGRPTVEPETIRTLLLEQLTAPVQWSATIRHMHADGAGRFVEVGAGRVLVGLARRVLGRDIEIATIGTAEDIPAALTAS